VEQQLKWTQLWTTAEVSEASKAAGNMEYTLLHSHRVATRYVLWISLKVEFALAYQTLAMFHVVFNNTTLSCEQFNKCLQTGMITVRVTRQSRYDMASPFTQY